MKGILLNTFLIIAMSVSPISNAASKQPEPTWTLNHESIDISSFVAEMTAISGKTFIVDPNVKGKITIISEQSLTRRGALELFYSVLSVHGYAAVSSDAGIKIIPQEKAKQAGLSVGDKVGLSKGLLITKIIPIKNAVASELVPVLRPLIPQYGHLGSVTEMNALIVSDHIENIQELEKLITTLDSTSDSRTQVIQLNNAWATDVFDTLEKMTSSNSKKGGSAISGELQIIADERTNRIIMKGKEQDLLSLKSIVDELDKPSDRASRLHVIPLRYADAKTTAELIQSLLFEGGSAQSGQSTIVKADISMNQLVVNAQPSILNDLKPIIDTLDVPRAQVKVEAIIAEVNMDDTNSAGIQWLIGDNAGVIGGTNFTTGGSSLSSIINGVSAGTAAVGTGATLASGATKNGLTFGGVLQALTTNSSANLLSTPQVVTLDNQEAKILVGESRPFTTGSYNDSTGNPFTTTTRHDIGLSLVVTPHINAEGEVTLVVNQTVESAKNEDDANGVVTSKREIKTIAYVADGETISLGGLMKDNVTLTKQKVPVLGDIPFLGALFRSSTLTTSKQNLVVFLRPTILRNKADSRKAARASYQSFRTLEINSPTGSIRPMTLDELLN